VCELNWKNLEMQRSFRLSSTHSPLPPHHPHPRGAAHAHDPGVKKVQVTRSLAHRAPPGPPTPPPTRGVEREPRPVVDKVCVWKENASLARQGGQRRRGGGAVATRRGGADPHTRLAMSSVKQRSGAAGAQVVRGGQGGGGGPTRVRLQEPMRKFVMGR